MATENSHKELMKSLS